MNATPGATTTIVVFEARPWWAPELERQFLDENVRVRACPSIRSLPGVVHEAEPAVVVLHLPSAAAESLVFLARSLERPNRPAVVAVVDRGTADLEWHVRELGAASVLHEFVTGPELATVCRRQFDRSAATS